MIENMYLTEMTIQAKVREIARSVEEQRLRSVFDVRPSALRHAVATAIVRFGVFLNGRSYHCPEVGAQTTR